MPKRTTALFACLMLTLFGCGSADPSPTPTTTGTPSSEPPAITDDSTPLTTDGFTIALPKDWIDVIGQANSSQEDPTNKYLISVCSPDKTAYFGLGAEPVPQGKTLDTYMAETTQLLRNTKSDSIADLSSEPYTIAGLDGYHVTYTVSGVPMSHYIFYAGQRLVTATTSDVSGNDLYADALQSIVNSLTVQ